METSTGVGGPCSRRDEQDGGKIGERITTIKRGLGRGDSNLLHEFSFESTSLTSGVSRGILLHNPSAANAVLTLVSKVAPKSLDLVRIPQILSTTGSS